MKKGKKKKDVSQTKGHQIIKKIGFDFDWDSKKVWKLKLPIKEMNINKLIWHFDFPFWEKDGTGDWNLTPWEVVGEPQRHSHHKRAFRADLRYPIDIMKNKGRWLILDGLHRLVRAYLMGQKKVKVRIVPRSKIPKILK